MAGADSIILRHPLFSAAQKKTSGKRRGSYLQVPLEADELQASHSSADEGGKDYGTDKEDNDIPAPVSAASTNLSETCAKSLMNKSASTPTLLGIGPKKRSFPKLLPSDELQRLLDGFTSRKSTGAEKTKGRRKST